MHVCRVQIVNFRNFNHIDVALAPNAVIVGENRIGKSNFIFALRLVLDSALSETARSLRFSDIWDGCDLTSSPQVEVHVDLTGFDDDPALTVLLTDHRLADDYTTARLSYVFRLKADVTGPPTSEADYEFKIFGGGVETNQVHHDTRRRICLDVLDALRDAESELGNWRYSPLRPLLEDAIRRVPKSDIDSVTADVNAATAKLGTLAPVKTLADDLRDKIAALAGSAQDMKTTLGFASTDAVRLFRSIGLYIDDGKRGITDASLGSANLALLALKLEEFAWRRLKNERNYTVVCVEEPEAHLHPHLQRQVFRQLLVDETDPLLGVVLTTHSPNIASVAPLSSIVLLSAGDAGGTKASSLAELSLDASDKEDLQRYLNVTRAELLFSRGVIFVEGDAEEALLPVFAGSMGIDLGDLGITVCNVGGVNFRPYVRLATALALPLAVVTDWDPLDGKKDPLGVKRSLDLVDDIRLLNEQAVLDSAERAALTASQTDLRALAQSAGIFMNTSTLEVEIANTPGLVDSLLSVLDDEGFGALRQGRLTKWRADTSQVNPEQLLAMIADIGKGRLAGRLAVKAIGVSPPEYIRQAIAHVAANA